MNGLYAQAQLQQQAINAIKNYNDTTIEKIKPHVVKLNPTTKVYKPKLNSAPKYPWNNSAPIVDPSVPQNTHSTVTSSTSSSSSSTGILSTVENDFSKYSTYIVLGGIALIVYFMFSGSSSKSKTKYVQIDVPE